ncbi:MAG: methylisocitrate lyase [Nitrospinota bacterium]
MKTAGENFRAALKEENPLQIIGTINAYSALLAEKAGFRAIYLSGAGVANASYGLPDIGMTSLDNVLEDVRRITGVTRLPLLVDIDTGWGSAFNIANTIRQMVRAGAGAVHIEDQVQAKRCGHRPGKALVSVEEMCDRVKVAADARTDTRFLIMARTDAYSVEGFQSAVERSNAYVEAGADMIFAEAMQNLEEYRKFAADVKVPVLANLTEYGKTPLFSLDDLKSAGIRIALYPLTAFRAMSAAANLVYQTVRREGTQKGLIESMQTREDLYKILDYHTYEKKLDTLLERENK